MNLRKQLNFVLAGLVCLMSIIFVYQEVKADIPMPRNVTREVQPAGVALSPGYVQPSMPGHTVGYVHVLTNTGTVTDTFSLTAISSLGWTVALFDEIHPSTVRLPVQLGAGMTATIRVSVTVPTVALSGTVAHTSITATSWTSHTVQAAVTDTTVVQRAPSVVLSPGQSKVSVAGSIVTFTHTITNTGPISDVFAVEAESRPGWSVELLEEDYQTRTLQMPLWLGELGSADFVVSVTVPSHTPDDTMGHIVVTATSLVSVGVMSAITDTITVQSDHVYRIFLPSIQSYEPPGVKLGVQFVHTTLPEVVEHSFPLLQDLGANWVRVFLSWPEIEPSPGQYNWDEFDVVFDRFRELGLEAMVVIYRTPDWATSEEGCGPISDTVALESFLDLAVPRYADVTDAWELFNEPDSKARWGLCPAEYTQQLSAFYTKIRSLDPNALLFLGGLAYDAWDRIERTFFERTLQNGAGPFFDGVSLHYYPINPVEFPTMAHKVNEIRDTMSRNGVYNKLVWVTETGMWVNSNGSLEAQRDFIVQEQSRGFGAGVDNIFWYAIRQIKEDPIKHRWLININHEPDNGYYTYQNFADKVEGLRCTGAYQNVPGDVEAYEFVGSGRSLYILWSHTVTNTVSIPASANAILTNRDGGGSVVLPIQTGEVTFEVGTQPIFVEIASAP